MGNLKKGNDIIVPSPPPPHPPPEIPVVQFFNFCSHLFIIPYQFKWDSNRNEFVLREACWRKMLSWLMHFTILAESLSSTPKFYFSDATSSQGISWVLQFVTIAWSNLGMVNLSYIIYWKKKDILDLANSELFRAGAYDELKLRSTWKEKLQVPISFAVTMCTAIINCFSREANPAFLVTISKVFPSAVYECPWMRYLYRIWGVPEVFAFAIHCTLFLSFVQTLRMASDLYGRRCQDRGFGPQLDGIMEARDVQREVTTRVNSILGMGILIHYVIAVIYFATLPTLTDTEFGVLGQQLWNAYFLVTSGLFWILASEHHLRINEATKEWLRRQLLRRSRKGDQGELGVSSMGIDMKLALVAFQNESENNQIGISCRFFTVTYGFMASMLGIIGTYATVMYQIRSM